MNSNEKKQLTAYLEGLPHINISQEQFSTASGGHKEMSSILADE